MIFSLIVAMGKNRAIGLGGQLPWAIPSEYQHYRALTRGKAVIIGRQNYELNQGEFAERFPIVVSRHPRDSYPYPVATSMEQALALAEQSWPDDEVFCLGGEAIYRLALPYAQRLYLSVVDYQGPADRFFPPHEHYDWQVVKKANHPPQGSKTPVGWQFWLLERKFSHQHQ